jgi:RNA polymerase sigma-70 factor (ECF subfamily)
MPVTPQPAALDRFSVRESNDFADSYQRHVGRVYAYVAARVASQELAEDVTSETFERALRSWRKAPAHGPIDRWLFGIARRTVADHFRRRRPAESLDVRHADTLVHAGPGPEEISVRREQLRAAGTLIASLTDEQRDVLSLRLIGELPYPDIAVIVGRSEAAVKKIAYRALTKIREGQGEVS